MEDVAVLLIVLIAARGGGWLARRLWHSPSVGEILAGVALAAVAMIAAGSLPLLDGMAERPAVLIAGEIGIFFLLLAAGVEMQPQELADHSREAFAVALGGMLLPLGLGFALAWAFLPETPLRSVQALVVGIGLSITAIPVTAKVLIDLGLLHQPIGEIVISAAVFDDVFGLLLLAIATGIIATGEVPQAASLGLLVGKVVLFFAATVAFGLFLGPKLWPRVAALPLPGATIGALLLTALAFSLLAHGLGMHFALGPFVAGLFFEKKTAGDKAFLRTKPILDRVTVSVLAPLFFASIGLRLDVTAMTTVPLFLSVLLFAAFAGKLIGAGLPAYWVGLSPREAGAVGIAMGGRGAVELIVASIAERAGVFDGPAHNDPIVGSLFSCLVMTAVVTTLFTPLFLRWILAPRSSAA